MQTTTQPAKESVGEEFWSLNSTQVYAAAHHGKESTSKNKPEVSLARFFPELSFTPWL
jgi:hypothetical protein